MDKIFDLTSQEAGTPLKCYAGLRERMTATDEFIKENQLDLHVPEDTIVEAIRIKQETNEPFGIEVLVHYLPIKTAKHFMLPASVDIYLREENPVDWGQITTTKESAQDLLDYMNFAWLMTREKRIVATQRSMMKLSTWLWLLNRVDLGALLYDEKLQSPHIVPALVKICEEMGIMVPMELRGMYTPTSEIIVPE